MELNKNLRESLLQKLKEALEKKDNLERVAAQHRRDSKKDPADRDTIAELFDLEVWLWEQQIATIEQALIDNNLKDW